MRWRVVEPWTTELSLAGTKALASANSLAHPQNPKESQFLPGNLLVLCKHPMLCFCRSIPPVGLTPSWCRRAPPEVDL